MYSSLYSFNLFSLFTEALQVRDVNLGESVLHYTAIFAGFKHTKSCILPAIHFHLNVGLMLGVSMNLQLSICIGLTMPSDKLYFVQILFCCGKYLIILP